MSFTSTFAARMAVSALGLSMAAAAMPATASAQQAQAGGGRTPQGWFKVCTKQEDNDVCIVQNLLTASNGQLVTAIGLITVQGKTNRKLMQVSVPSARLIPTGIQMQIDGGKAAKLDYAVCMPDKCIAEVPLTDGMIASLKKGGEVVFTSVNFQRAPNPIKISLEGFTGAFDGEPIEQSKLEERQRLLQEEMQKKAEDARKKLEDAQKAAKQQ
ncbi:invasion associated locus B family protein [Ensifer soli]|uniref:invasion associated locus B family protein n=1 Tax=Ciceribacter sp. sgz301302 TaxID=3342379 RepID=UPI0035B6D9C3